METGLIIMSIILIVAIGGLVYVLATKDGGESDIPKGALHINYNSANYEMFLTLDVPVEEVISKKKITLRVNVIRENSHK